ncbi:ABC transporter ATP-binding protein [Ningiella sp. W23]|uniref:ABC transporter ATP-binding protein n=1 Tax=Ningiella sp. W23 TaxID=3023715 RepID=UPI0037568232
MFQIKNIVKHYNRTGKNVKAVDDISFNVHAGEILAFLGLNGAGKTTAIKIIAGLIKADSGGLLTSEDEKVDRNSISALLEGHRNLYSRMTAKENLVYFGVLRGLGLKASKQRAEELLTFFGLDDKANEFAQKLSRGMQQRLAVSVAMMQKPKLLLLDEPTLGVDYDNTQLLVESLQKLKAEGVAILFTTHELAIAERLADRVAIIREGKLVTDKIQPKSLQSEASYEYKLVVERSEKKSIQELASLYSLDVEDNCVPSINQSLLPKVLSAINPINIVSLTKKQPSFEQIFIKHARSTSC